MCNKLSHFDKNGNAVMVDVSDKPITHRTAIATGSIQVGAEIMEHLTAGTVAKGDVLGSCQSCRDHVCEAHLGSGTYVPSFAGYQMYH